MAIGILLVVLMMLVGYSALEVGRFLRSRRRPDAMAYGWFRLGVRLVMATIVAALGYLWFRWDELQYEVEDAQSLIRIGLVVLLCLLALDLMGLTWQYRREQQRRESEFLKEIESLVQKDKQP